MTLFETHWWVDETLDHDAAVIRVKRMYEIANRIDEGTARAESILRSLVSAGWLTTDGTSWTRTLPAASN